MSPKPQIVHDGPNQFRRAGQKNVSCPGYMGIRPCTLRASIEGNDLLLGGDIILSINGIEVLEGDASLDSIYESVSNLKAGERIVARVLRAGHVIELSTVITQ